MFNIKMNCCCNLRGLSIFIFCAFGLINIVFLVGFIVTISEPQQYIDVILRYIDDNSETLKDQILQNSLRDILVKNTTEHFALPITITVILTVANILALWGTLFNLHLLIFPWILLYSAFIIFVTSLLVYFLVILENVWIKIILFLVVSPSIVICIACCLTVYCIYRVIMKTGKIGY